jgi:hypothetical protein
MIWNGGFHDLKLTRQVTMQSLPSIRLVQENDKSLIGKINSTLVNTVPLWRQQLAQAITIYRSGQAAETVKAATDLTNQLLTANAENLRQANVQARTQIERGVFDIETVKKANQTLIATIEDSLRIADEGRRRRQEAATQLESCETELRQALAAAHAKTPAKPNPPCPEAADMGLWDKLLGEFIDVIQWIDDSNDTLVYRFERQGNEIKFGAKLTVREGRWRCSSTKASSPIPFSPACTS